jgi:nucleotide-binding universal stress UspA family protein
MMSTIVVGVDGSEGSLSALRFAIEEARIRGAEVKAVNAWHVPPAVYGGGWAPAGVDFDEFRKLAEAALDKTLEDVGARESGVSVTAILREGQPADVLCAEAPNRDDLLVVGSRGLGGFRGLLLGSVSQQAVHHSACPVVVVPPAETKDENPASS